MDILIKIVKEAHASSSSSVMPPPRPPPKKSCLEPGHRSINLFVRKANTGGGLNTQPSLLCIWVFLHIRVPFWIMMHHKPSIFVRKERECSTTATTRGRNGWQKEEGRGDRDSVWGDWRRTDQWSESAGISTSPYSHSASELFSLTDGTSYNLTHTHMRIVTIQDNSLEIWTNTFQQNYSSMLTNWFQNKTKNNVFSSLKTVKLDIIRCLHPSLQHCMHTHSVIHAQLNTYTDALIQTVTCFLSLLVMLSFTHQAHPTVSLAFCVCGTGWERFNASPLRSGDI